MYIEAISSQKNLLLSFLTQLKIVLEGAPSLS